MSSYLLTCNYNPFATAGDVSQQTLLDYKPGDVVRWPCDNKQVVVGDIVYLMKLGEGVRGLIAKGVVSAASYVYTFSTVGADEQTCIDFRLETHRQSCEEGIVPQVLLFAAFPNQQWEEQESGLLIEAQYQQQIDELWQQGESLHSLNIYFNWIKQHKFNTGWCKVYKEMCELGTTIKQSQQINERQLEAIWAKKTNGIASVGQGFMYREKEYDLNKEYLRELTLSILDTPSKSNYNRIYKEWKAKGGFTRMLWAVIRRVFALADSQTLTSIVGDSYLKVLFEILNEQFELNTKYSNLWFDDNAELLSKTAPYLSSQLDTHTRNILLWQAYEYSQPKKKKGNDSDEPQDTAPVTAPDEKTSSAEVFDPSQLNRILYGPAGTGKTYSTVKMAVDTADPTFAKTEQSRECYKTRYDELVGQNRIRFVTFHQSFGYEEFVEGLKASSDGGNISYDVEDGIFKNIALQAEKYIKTKAAKSSYSFGKAWQAFTESLAEVDFIEVKMSKTSFKVLSFNDKRIVFEKQNGSLDHTLSIATLQAIFEGKREYNSGLGVYYHPLVRYLKRSSNLEQVPAIERQNFVLIIDEINRGNISKIFGELITLIEPSKRLGRLEALTVTLPYSGDIFSIPDNLYIIGTMNTADRSLALMDTALRRRFDFVELMPDHTVLTNAQGLPAFIEITLYMGKKATIDLQTLLVTLNKRISALYDREHTIGHAFFMPVIEKLNEDDHEAALQTLASCFKNKIIPLLGEYFFEDWQKIQLVLGDNQKPKKWQLIQKLDVNLESLFGNIEALDVIDDETREFQLIEDDSKQWDDPMTYIGMYDISRLGD